MITTIAKQFTFDAAHFIPTVPEDHKCRRMHGHTYVVELRFTGNTSKEGFCAQIDYDDIAQLWKMEFEPFLDHRTLNDVGGLEIPTTEVLVEWIFTKIHKVDTGAMFAIAPTMRLVLSKALTSIRVRESSSTWCEWSR